MNMLRFVAALGLSASLALPASAQILSGQNSPNPVNLLDNGAFNVNQRGSAGVTAASITTSAKYLQDRWAMVSGTSTSGAMTNVTSGLPAQFTNAAQLQRTSGQTGVVKVCLLQEIPTIDFTPIAGQPITLSFWALAGANFSAASSALVAQVTTGTGSDEGLATWLTGLTGAASAIPAANATVTLSTSWQRFAVTGTALATATEGVVNICWTPVGTAGTNDYIQVTGVQLQQGTVATNIEFRPYATELAKAQRYYYGVAESKTAINFRAVCSMSTTSIANCAVPFPQVMRAAPTMTYTAGFTASASTASTSATVCTALTTTATLTGNAASTTGVLMDCASSTGFGAAGTSGFLWDLGTSSSTGVIQASADF